MAKTIDFGLFDWIDTAPGPLAALYESRLRPMALPTVPVYGYHLAEHHSTPLGMAPSPTLFLRPSLSAPRVFAFRLWRFCCRFTIRCA